MVGMNRRGFMAGVLAAGVAPPYIGASVLMPVKALALPTWGVYHAAWLQRTEFDLARMREMHEVEATLGFGKWEVRQSLRTDANRHQAFLTAQRQFGIASADY